MCAWSDPLGKGGRAMHAIQSAVKITEPSRLILDEAASFAADLACHRQAIFAYLYHLLGDADDAEDLTQETFLKAYAASQHGEAHPNRVAWLYRIASNTALDVFRRRQRICWLPWNPVRHDQLIRG